MSRLMMFTLFYLAVFLQAGAYGLTFLLPPLFDEFGANEKVVGSMLFLTTISTLITVYYAGHLSDVLGRMRVLGIACLAISASLAAYGMTHTVGPVLYFASAAMGFGWGLTYALTSVVLTRLVRADERVRYFAVQSVALMAGFGLSPVMAAQMERAGFAMRDAFFLTAALCAIAALVFFALIRPVRLHSEASGPETRSSLSPTTVFKIMGSPARLPVIMVCIGASVFAGMNNFQTVFAQERGLNYADYFLAYTVTVVVFRMVLARFKGGSNPYLTIAALQYIMCGSVVLFLSIGANVPLYLVTAFLFGIGYGVSYPILAAMAANDAPSEILPQTLQFFALTYFIGIFGFPLVAGWMIVELGSPALLTLITALAGIEATMAALRGVRNTRSSTVPL